jgi:hypothetical protein
MKAIGTVVSDQKLRRVAAEVETQIREVFVRCPELAGFAIKDGSQLPSSDVDPSEVKPRLFVTDIDFSLAIGNMELEEAYTLIHAAISDVISEQPEAFELLRGRTFARVLH